MTVTKDVLSKKISEKFDIGKAESKGIIDDMFNIITNNLTSGKEVRLHGFGRFKLIDKKARLGRNPQTGEPHEIKERRVCVLKSGKSVRQASKINAQKKALFTLINK